MPVANTLQVVVKLPATGEMEKHHAMRDILEPRHFPLGLPFTDGFGCGFAGRSSSRGIGSAIGGGIGWDFEGGADFFVGFIGSHSLTANSGRSSGLSRLFFDAATAARFVGCAASSMRLAMSA